MTRLTSLYSGSVSVQLIGELDLASVPALTEQLACALGVSPDLVVDLREVTFLDAAVMATLLRAQQRALVEGGSLVLVGATPWVEKVLRVARVTDAIPLLPHQRTAQTPHARENEEVSLNSALRRRRTSA